jgi:hypothetical protein
MVSNNMYIFLDDVYDKYPLITRPDSLALFSTSGALRNRAEWTQWYKEGARMDYKRKGGP